MAANMEMIQKLQREITCEICRTCFSQPVTLHCGHSFCQACLSCSLTLGATYFTCPQCRQFSQSTELPAINVCLEKLTNIGKQLIFLSLKSPESRSQCPTHKEAAKLFCEEDQTFLCVHCSQTAEHATHTFSPIEEACLNYREKLQQILRDLEKHCKEVEKLLSQEERPFVDSKLMITGEYSKFHIFLWKEKSHCLDRLKEEHRIREERISQHMQSLQEFMQELQKSIHKPNAELLQDVKDLWRRSESRKSQRLQDVKPELRQYPITGMIEVLNRFRVDIRVDPQSSSPYVIVSEDQRSLWAAEGWQGEPNHSEDPAHHYVFAEQTFNSGIHYWEVDVIQVPQWSLGIHAPCVKRSREGSQDSRDCVYVLRYIKVKDIYYLLTYPGLLNHQVKDPIPRIGIYLECSSGTLAFYNALQSTLIYRFSLTGISRSVRPIFSPGPPLQGTKPGPMTLCSVNSRLRAGCYSSL
ncbi:tripartite motif-containing protein 43-like [Monodelphis domestica]|uniref:tripartite motif-containing protein 43-like n=1 Tax=Monodelphis domestica TaxID=13616 RepID=UPI0024E26918|nr:tripartite motif-containing protein 43-like [Monodelphis domestica]